MTTMCGAAGCAADAVEDVPDVATKARTRDDPEYVALTGQVPMCAEHARVMRLRAMAPYALRIAGAQPAAAAALGRMELAAAGDATREDLATVDRFVADAQEVNRLAEDSRDPEWQAMAAQVDTLTTAMETELRRHLS